MMTVHLRPQNLRVGKPVLTRLRPQNLMVYYNYTIYSKHVVEIANAISCHWNVFMSVKNAVMKIIPWQFNNQMKKQKPIHFMKQIAKQFINPRIIYLMNHIPNSITNQEALI